MTEDELKTLYSNATTRNAITSVGRLRGAGGFHEWYKVAKAPTFKAWGMTAEDIMTAVTPTKEMNFYGIDTPEGIKNGVHGIDTASVSAYAHMEMDDFIDSSNSRSEYDKKLINWGDEHFARSVIDDTGIVKITAGSKGLPEHFQNVNKEIKDNSITVRCEKK